MQPDPIEFHHRFPAAGGLLVGVMARRDGLPIDKSHDLPVYARYYVIDEFDTPVLDPSCNWFASPAEALFVAKVYAKLVDDFHPCPGRSFHDFYARYISLSWRIPAFIETIITGGETNAALRKLFVDK